MPTARETRSRFDEAPVGVDVDSDSDVLPGVENDRVMDGGSVGVGRIDEDSVALSETVNVSDWMSKRVVKDEGTKESVTVVVKDSRRPRTEITPTDELKLADIIAWSADTVMLAVALESRDGYIYIA